MIQDLFEIGVNINNNLIELQENTKEIEKNQKQTKDAFSEKWKEEDEKNVMGQAHEDLKQWFLNLYGYASEHELKLFLNDKSFILDAGCGSGYKAAWIASLAPHATVIAVDISDSVLIASKKYKGISNLFFLKSDIVETKIVSSSIDFTICDQVLMHTEVPERTFRYLSNITKEGGEFACYVYRKKALPRESLDDYFRSATHNISKKDIWEMSKQLTILGKNLARINAELEVPGIPLLGIKAGKYDVQRFIYWNFIKCFWREDWSDDMSDLINFDWYAPSNAKRYSKEEFLEMAADNNVNPVFFHEEEACYTGRFKK